MTRAAADAHAWLDGNYAQLFTENAYFKDARWRVPASRALIDGQATFFADPDEYPTDDRGLAYSYALFSTKHLGAGQFYLMTITDRDGRPFSGAHTYRLTVPADPPVSQYWSATLYDRATHALIRDQPRASRASTSDGLQTNSDGTVDLHFGSHAPEGQDSNWVPTTPGREFEVLFRLYGPQQPLFDKTWQLPDIERLR